MAYVNRFFDKDYEVMEFEELAGCPVEAIRGLSQGDVEKLRDAFNVRTIQNLAENQFVRIAQAITALS